MRAVGVIGLFLIEALRFSAAHFAAKHASLQPEAGGVYDVIARLVNDFQKKSRMQSLKNRSAVLRAKAPNLLASNVRQKPGYFNELVSYFEYLDENQDSKLSELEFMKVMDYDTSLRSDGNEVYVLFSDADGKNGLTLQEFVRLVTVVTKAPEGFDFHADDLEAMPSSTVGEDQDRDAIMQLFAIFDENSSGDIGEAEFEHAWMGPTLWTCRKKGIVSSAWMADTAEYEWAKGVFAERAGANGVLSLAEFAHLLKDSVPHRNDHYSKGSPEYKGPVEVEPMEGPFRKPVEMGSSQSIQGISIATMLLVATSFGLSNLL